MGTQSGADEQDLTGSSCDHEVILVRTKHRFPSRDLSWWVDSAPGLGFLAAILVVLLAGEGRLAILILVPVVGLSLIVQPLASRQGEASTPDTTSARVAPIPAVSPEDEPATSGRLVCYGVDRELRELVDLDRRRQRFEPVIPDMSWSYFPSSGGYAGLGVFAVCLWFDLSMAYAMLAVCVLWSFMWGLVRLRRTYFRVYPGRFEVLRASFWGHGVRLVESFDLRQLRIVCRYDKRELVIAPIGAEEETGFRVDLSPLSAPHAFVQTVFAAAVSPDVSVAPPSESLAG